MKKTLCFLLTLGVLSAFGSSARAQGLREVMPSKLFGGGLTLAVPVGEFDRFVDVGGGLNGFAVINFDRDGYVGIRFDGAILWYGNENWTAPLSPTIPWVLVDVNTDNFITSFGLGPQFTLGRGPIRPYAYGTVGFSYFATVTSARGTANIDPFASSTNFDDVTFALAAGGGLLLQLSRGRTPVSLDLNVYTLQNGQTEYLREGSIRDNRDGTISVIPIRSEANLVGFRLGVAVGVF
jgi:hypothetical protein